MSLRNTEKKPTRKRQIYINIIFFLVNLPNHLILISIDPPLAFLYRGSCSFTYKKIGITLEMHTDIVKEFGTTALEKLVTSWH